MARGQIWDNKSFFKLKPITILHAKSYQILEILPQTHPFHIWNTKTIFFFNIIISYVKQETLKPNFLKG